MRTYGKIDNLWKVIETLPNGDNSEVYLTTLVQTLKLNRGESPFWANYGIPAQPTVVSQLFPDYYLAQTQNQFSQYFISLQLARNQSPTPTYTITATTPRGSLVNRNIAT